MHPRFRVAILTLMTLLFAPLALVAPVHAEDEPARTFYLLESGKVAVEIEVSGVAHTLQTLREGDVLGVSWLFPPYRWHFGARALQATAALRFDGEAVRRELDLDHELGYLLLHRFAAVLDNRLQAARLQLLDLYGGGPA